MRDTFIGELLSLAHDNPNIVLVVGDLGYGVIDQFADELPNQFLNAGIAEQSMMSLSAGLASTGYKVFVYSIANFPTLRALEQIRNDVCYHGLDVTVVSVGAGVAYGALGYTHHAVEDIAIMRALPNMRVVSPADPMEARIAAREGAELGGPAYIRLGKNGEPQLHREVSFRTLTNPLQLRPGSDVLLVASGSIVARCLESAETLSTCGVEAQVLSCPTVRPLSQALIDTIASGIPIVTIEEHAAPGGFGSALLEATNDIGLRPQLRRLTLSDKDRSLLGSAEFLRNERGLSPAFIASQVLDFIGRLP